MADAYLVVILDVTKPAPVVIGVGIHSESAMEQTAYSKWAMADLCSWPGETFALAAEGLCKQLAYPYSFHRWVIPFLRQTDRDKIAEWETKNQTGVQ